MKLINPLNIGNLDNIRRVSDGYYRNEVGTLVRAGPNTARFRYDEDGNFQGVLAEPVPYQSVISKSDDFTDAGVWLISGVTLGSTTDGPDGVSTSAREIEGSGTLRVVDKYVQPTTFRLQTPARTDVIVTEFTPVGGVRPFVAGIGLQRRKSSGSLSPQDIPWPVHQAGDIGILMVRASGFNVGLVDASWTEFASGGHSAPFRTFWKRATSSSEAPAVVTHRGGSGAQIVTIRGAAPSGSPFGVVLRDDGSPVTDTRTLDGFLSAEDLSLVVFFGSYFLATPTQITSEWNNPSLSNMTIHQNGTGTAQFYQGGMFVVSGRFTVGGTISSAVPVRSSLFVRHREGDGRIRIRNHITGDFQEFDMVSPTPSTDTTVEMYRDGWYRLTVSSYGPYGFEIQILGGEFDLFRANLVATPDYYQPLLDLNPMTGDVVLPYTTSQLVYSNIPEPDPDYEPEVDATIWEAGTYPVNSRVIYDHGLYISLRETDDRPDIGAAKREVDDPQSWSRLGTSNHWKMYDMLRGVEYQSVRDNIIDQQIFVPKVARGYAVLGIVGTQLRVQATHNGEVVYDQTHLLIDLSGNAYWYSFFMNLPTQRTSVVAFDLPPIPGLLVRFTLTGEGPVAIGKLIVGEELEMGCTKWNVKTEYVNTSRQEREEFGDLVLVPRRVYKIKDFEIRFPTLQAESVERTIEKVIGGPAVFVGSVNYSTTVIYGIVKDFRPVLVNKNESLATLKVESI